MINLYFGDSIPEGVKYIVDVEPLHTLINFLYDDYTRMVLKEIEQGTPQTDNTFLDRFGRGFYACNLSTSSKILLLAHQRDCIISADEIGRNALAFFLRNAPRGSLHFSFFPDMRVPARYPLRANGFVCNNESDFLDFTAEGIKW